MVVLRLRPLVAVAVALLLVGAGSNDAASEEGDRRELGSYDAAGKELAEYLLYPTRREDCPSDYKACVIGNMEMADMFELNTKTPMVQGSETRQRLMASDFEDKSYTLPEG